MKPIEEIEVGDKVLAYDEETGEQAYKEVVRLFRNQTNEWYHIHANAEEIICTGGHPFYIPQLGKFIPANKLVIGTNLLLFNGSCAKIERAEVERLSNPETTYNFEVEDYHTYYVTESKILVHNKCKYYEATRTKDGVIKGDEITKKQALNRVRNGQDVIASSRSAAKSLAKDAFGNAKVFNEIHPEIKNAMPHFHDKLHHFYHIFY